MNKDMKKMVEEALTEIKQVLELKGLDELRIKYLSKSGLVSKLMMEIRNVPNEEKPEYGAKVNQVKNEIFEMINAKKQALEDDVLIERLKSEKIDVTIPGYSHLLGSIHPLNLVVNDVEDFFLAQGYEIVEGPEIERDFYNFEMMNMGLNHPARAMQDSFYIDEKTLLRTHTSPVQARTMLERNGAPIKMIAPGKVYRRDDDDATHSHQFMQIEGLVIDQDINFAHLKNTLLTLAKHLFGENKEIRLRPSYFPFTEPSVEVDVVYEKENGEKVYLEVLGAGLIHPNVLKMGGYDVEKYSGFAFGIGVERIAILKYQIEDIRHFYTNDVRFLKQFKGGY